MAHGLLAHLERRAVVVAHDVVKLRVGDVALHVVQVEEALVALGQARGIACGQQAVELHGHQRSVDHRVLRGAGMHAHAGDFHLRGGGVERLVGDFTLPSAVHGVGELCAELGDVKVRHAHADLLVRGEGDAEPAVRLVFRDDGLHGGENFRDAGLVVRAQQRGAVGGDERHAFERRKRREALDRQHVARAGKHHVAAIVIRMNLRLHVLAGVIGRGVHVRDEAQRGQAFTALRGAQPAVDHAELVDMGVFKAQRGHLLHQHVRQVKLDRGGRRGGRGGIGGGVHLDVLEESFTGSHKILSLLAFEI